MGGLSGSCMEKLFVLENTCGALQLSCNELLQLKHRDYEFMKMLVFVRGFDGLMCLLPLQIFPVLNSTMTLITRRGRGQI